jgi:hypothetical protein
MAREGEYFEEIGDSRRRPAVGRAWHARLRPARLRGAGTAEPWSKRSFGEGRGIETQEGLAV